jgi:hypothetical protein
MKKFIQWLNEVKQTFQYFGFHFDVDKALKLVTKYPVEMITPTQEMMGTFLEVDKDYAMGRDLSKPILFATVLVENKQYNILIDGHHRLYKALAEKVKQIPSITLNLKDTLTIMFPNKITAKMKQEAKKLKLL